MKRLILILVLAALPLVAVGCSQENIAAAKTMLAQYETALAEEQAKPNPDPKIVAFLQDAIPKAKASVAALEASGGTDIVTGGVAAVTPLIPPPYNLALPLVLFIGGLFKKKPPQPAPTA